LKELAMRLDFSNASYGRRAETDAIFRRFDAMKNLLMPGPRRLGKTFVLQRLEERASNHNYVVVSFDVSHCRDEKRILCEALPSH
jgi:predicted AAA+ superfamily ATPase